MRAQKDAGHHDRGRGIVSGLPPKTSLIHFHDIVYDTMNAKKLRKIRGDIQALRQGSPNARDLEKIAKQVGRNKVNRGKEPTWECREPPMRPLSIPHHGGAALPRGTKNSILDALDGDCDAWEDYLYE